MPSVVATSDVARRARATTPPPSFLGKPYFKVSLNINIEYRNVCNFLVWGSITVKSVTLS